MGLEMEKNRTLWDDHVYFWRSQACIFKLFLCKGETGYHCEETHHVVAVVMTKGSQHL